MCLVKKLDKVKLLSHSYQCKSVLIQFPCPHLCVYHHSSGDEVVLIFSIQHFFYYHVILVHFMERSAFPQNAFGAYISQAGPHASQFVCAWRLRLLLPPVYGVYNTFVWTVVALQCAALEPAASVWLHFAVILQPPSAPFCHPSKLLMTIILHSDKLFVNTHM